MQSTSRSEIAALPAEPITDDPATWPAEMREAIAILADMFRSFFRQGGRLPVEQTTGQNES